MYKSKTKSNLPSPILGQRSSSPFANPSKAITENQNHSSAIDLRNFNDYLQQRIAKSALRKELEMSQGPPQKTQGYGVLPSQSMNSKQFTKVSNTQNFKESRIKKSREQPAASKQGWRKHESIEKLLNKENHFAEDDNRRTQHEQQALKDLERKYQELQEKYKLLMKETSQNAREFERDKKELARLKEVHQDDQNVLAELKEELRQLQDNVGFEGNNGNKSSMLKVKSQCSIPLESCNWESKLMIDSRPETPIRGVRHKTSENWTANIDKKALFQSDEKQRLQQSRCYSTEKQMEQMRRSTKAKKSSDHTHYSNISNVESKTSIRLHESMRGSRAVKPMTETCIRMDEKSLTPTMTTLQKKVMNPKPYSKYRFQPSYKFE